MAYRPTGSDAPNDSLPPTPGAYPSTPGNDQVSTIVSTQLSLSQAVYRRRGEFTRSYTTKVKVGTWNVASLSGTDKDIEGWFVGGKGLSESLNGLAIDRNRAAGRSGRDRSSTATSSESTASQERRRSKKSSTMPKNDTAYLPGGNEIGLYVLGLQEIVDISSAAEALRPYPDPHPGKKWKQAVEKALPKGYQLVAEQQLIGLYMMIYASPALAPQISSVSTTSVGTGLMGYMGNKGAVTARIVLGETTRMVFINCHLTAGVEKGNLERRNWDAAQIINRTKFDPVYDGSGVMEEFSEGIGDEDFAFWFGDLNYRLESLPGDDVRRLLMLHTRNEYGKGEVSSEKIEEELAAQRSPVSIKDGRFVDPTSEHDGPPTPTTNHASSADPVPLHDRLYSDDHIEPATDPASLQTTLSSLLPHDQLHAQMRTRKAFHDGWQEGPIDFLPTYKYDVGSVGMFDSSEKKRGPSWCDRILYRTRREKQAYDGKIRAEQEAKRQEDEMKARGIDQASFLAPSRILHDLLRQRHEAEAEAVLFDYDPDTDADNDYQDDISDKIDPDIVETKAGSEDKIHLDYYTSHQRVLSSDHKPLDAVFTLTYDAVDPQMKAKVHQEVARELDKAENEGRPVVTVVIDHHHDHDDNMPQDVECASFEGVNFGHVKYNHPKTRNITVANTGRVPATVGFVDREVNQGQPTGIAPSWLTIRFDRHGDNQGVDKEALQRYTLEPGDAANVELTVHIKDATAVRAFNEGRHKVEDVLVLRIHDGRDYFLPLRGIWLQSSFGRSVDRLLRIPEGGIRKLQHQRPDGNSHGHDDDSVKWSAPREIFRLTETIEELVERTVAEWGMRGDGVKPPWDDLGWPFANCDCETGSHGGLSESIREALDTDQAFKDVYPQESTTLQRLDAVARALVEFLSSLDDGVITAELWTRLEKSMIERGKSKVSVSGEDERMQSLEILSTSPAHSVLFNLITFMLSRVAGEIQPVGLPSDGSTVILDQSARPSEVPGRSAALTNAQGRARRLEIDKAYASIFAKAMIRLPAIGKDKERKASEARRKHMIETFLRTESIIGMTHTPRLPHFVTYSIKHPLLDFVFSSLTVWKTKVIDSTRDPDEEMPKSTRAQKKAALATQQAAIPAHSTPIDSSSTLPVYFHREHTPPYGFLSQWYASSFYDPAANITYTSAEQRMMHHKALLCADAATASLILSSSDPGEQKALGRKVKGFREKEKDWDRIKFETAVEGNWLKFTRATEHGAWLKARLLETGERVLAEASRSDRVWGIGLNAGEAGDRLGEWGENLLGKALMSVRERIREEERKKTGEGEGEIDGSEHTP